MTGEQKPSQSVFTRWPLLLASVTLIGAAIGIDLSTEEAYAVAAGVAALGAATLGAFVYAEGARHREWLHETIWKRKDERSEEDTS
jgi:multidrug transporter EmrE-like cation transporter